jgi:hypothetical protein
MNFIITIAQVLPALGPVYSQAIKNLERRIISLDSHNHQIPIINTHTASWLAVPIMKEEKERNNQYVPRSALDRDDYYHEDKNHDQNEERHELHVLPPHLSLQVAAADPEIPSAIVQSVRLVNEQVDPLASLEQAFDILRHDASNIVNLSLRIANRVVHAAAGRAKLHHQVLHLGVERAGAVVGHVGKVGALGELFEKALANL